MPPTKNIINSQNISTMYLPWLNIDSKFHEWESINSMTVV